MSNLKDTDIDDLFRRASDKYPLRTDSSDWDRMVAALEKNPPPDPPYHPNETDERRKRRFIWLFLLLPLAGAGYLFLHHPGNGLSTGNGTANPAVATTQKATAPSTTDQTATGQTATGQLTTPQTPAATHSSTAQASTAQAITRQTPSAEPKTSEPQTAQLKTPAPNTPPTTSAATPPATNPAIAVGPAGAGMPQKAHRMANSNNPKSQGKGIRSIRAGEDSARGGAWRSSSDRAHGDIPVRPGSTTPTTTTKTPSNNGKNQFADDNITNITTTTTDAFTLRATNINGRLAPTTNPYYVSVDVQTPANKPQDTTRKPTSAKKRSSYIYAGILGAPDLSTVHFQKMTGTGSTFTLLLGYAFNSHWAIETGVSVDRKRYYTSGEYFTVPKNMLNNGYSLKNADGTCYMWEIPLNVRYNFNPNGKTKWFGTAGLSTYLMTKENYNYQYGWNGWGPTWDSSYSTKKPSQYPFSVINLSIGFEQRLGKIGNLRIEPYARIPLGGVGTGKLRILSTGVNIGFTRQLWK